MACSWAFINKYLDLSNLMSKAAKQLISEEQHMKKTAANLVKKEIAALKGQAESGNFPQSNFGEAK